MLKACAHKVQAHQQVVVRYHPDSNQTSSDKQSRADQHNPNTTPKHQPMNIRQKHPDHRKATPEAAADKLQAISQQLVVPHARPPAPHTTYKTAAKPSIGPAKKAEAPGHTRSGATQRQHH